MTNKQQSNVIDISDILEQFKGSWVTLTNENTVITANKSAKTAYEDALKKGYEKPILFKVPMRDLPHIG